MTEKQEKWLETGRLSGELYQSPKAGPICRRPNSRSKEIQGSQASAV